MTTSWQKWLKKETQKVQEKDWDFNKFKIQCNKCQSYNTEINGSCELEHGYYDEVDLEGGLLIKCHTCGQAMIIEIETYQDIKTIKESEKNNDKTK